MSNKNTTCIQVKKEISNEEEQCVQRALQFSEIFVKEEYTDSSSSAVEGCSFDYRNKSQQYKPLPVKIESVSDDELWDNECIIDPLKTDCSEKNSVTEKQTFLDKSDRKRSHNDKIAETSFLKQDFLKKVSGERGCKKEYDNSDLLIKEYKCDICKEVTTSIYSMRNHILFHLGRRHVCTECHKSFYYPTDLKRHLKDQHEIEEKVCDICGKFFSRKSVLRKHVISHDKRKKYKYKCNICENTFSCKYSLQKHLMRHDSVKKFKTCNADKIFSCHICNRTFNNRGRLSSHIQSHSNIRKHECKVCGRLFRRKCDVTSHMVLHSDRDRKFNCNICNISFFMAGHLDAHLKSHKKPVVNNIVCHICSKSFTHQFLMTDHLLTHSEVKAYVCKICNKSFLRQCYMDTHSRMHN